MKLKEIHKDCQRKMRNAIANTYTDANDIIDLSYDIYYAGGTPEKYVRTDMLRNSKKVDSPIIGGDSVFLRAGYEASWINYDTGTFTGGEVLGATMTGTYGVVGDPSYDEMAFEDIIKAAEKNFSKEFG